MIRLPLPPGTWEDGSRPSFMYLNKVALLTLRYRHASVTVIHSGTAAA
ncbi:MAG: hypothetical protein M3075_09575 [Candidatus Dormibacteraeota bacterium]|nr:hypothetical protein [Candidatus Dormibacteraeota bacterium]